MKVGIMQPYFFPYLGYFQLIHAVDRFVIYDDVNYIKGGWINRNFILGKDGPQRITLQLSGASPNKLINEVDVGANQKKLLMTIEQLYSKAPYFQAIYPTIEECLSSDEKNLALFLEHTLRRLCTYLGIETEILVSSHLEKDNSLRGSDKVTAICKRLEGDTYINAIGGQKLYDRDRFRQEGLELFFLQMGAVTYPQHSSDFVPNLSVIDLMMFNPRHQFWHFLQDYTLV